ncbi:hypothetical protein VUR80DRAFT_3367 [Thermomyces stellatus]
MDYYTSGDQLPLDLESSIYDFHPDGATDSAASPASPILPEPNTYQLPQGSGWLESLAKGPQSPSIDPSAIHTQNSASASPAVNPLELGIGIGSDPVFGAEGLQGLLPIFDSAGTPSHQSTSKSRKTSGTGAAPTQGCYNTPPSSTSEELRYPSRKRKSLASTSDSATSSPNAFSPPSPPSATRRSPGSPVTGVKKTAHNMIEKRYRNNLNDKINALRDAVPSLRVAQYRIEQGINPELPVEDLGEETLAELGGLEPPQKLNKATILAKAAEYIKHLENRNQQLTEENEALKAGTRRSWA